MDSHEIDPSVRVRGARVHNLRDVDVDMPRNALVAFTGVSGSGKSSLAFGTLYAESQRRYLESVAPYARRLLHQIEAPDVDEVTGLPPTVVLAQRRSAPSSRSTVGTVTAISNSLRLLMSREGDYPDGPARSGPGHYPEGTNRLYSDAFSPNTVEGACPRCHGQGVVHEATEASMVPDPSLTIRDGAIASWPGAWQGKNLRDVLAALGYDIDRPWRELAPAAREWILFTDDRPVVTVEPEREPHRIHRPYQGTYTSAERLLLRAHAESKSEATRARAAEYLHTTTCPLCAGRRLKPEALAVTFAGYNITELAELPLAELGAVLRPYTAGTSAAAVLTQDLLSRIEVLVELGLGYLSVDRESPTLSGGELQRLRLAGQLRSGLFGVVYILDEPSAGLHPADTAALTTVLGRLKDSGNSVFLVEHDLDVVRHADWLIDIGPGAGVHGGQVLYSGAVEGLRAVPASVTRPYLFDEIARPVRVDRAPGGVLALREVSAHNLRDLDLDVPLGVFTAITGVSGSGKSSLLHAISVTAAADPAIVRVVEVDQAPIGRTPRSNLATYTGLFDTVRKLFAATDAAAARGYGVGRFSFNVAEGRCPTCQGEGYITVELLFLPSTYSPCPDCHGARYNPETLEITYRDTTIAGVLDMTVDRAAEFLADVPAVARALRTLAEVGLGYLRLGQPATELSGGEAQRVKLATELQRARRAGTLYLLDEPTTGLHPADTDILLTQLNSLVDGGATVVVVEHDMTVVAQADHVVDLGPGGGAQGGRIVAQGSPAQVAADSGSRTAPYLAERMTARPGKSSAIAGGGPIVG
ncbi:putative UvrABC system protein A [Nocardia asteroides NBRC 15531]|uniref:UvrABC system protein A n=2 Tax=Nocardia asteroides TaxID=1824 RepID=U5EG13_NOCAS|nr:excinuclease ABC subunit UvrA [Nocardia asteroides]UGT51510.1 excinuclease ABC subunit UvrA [Nocardia asteroides]GAD86245.1 putative UvrABC system protein A [Nocardia asteroides NBRC 15531]